MIRLFVGPSLFDIKNETVLFEKYKLYPPVKKNDIRQLIELESEPDTIIIADGVFFPFPAVGHREIRDAIAKGWNVWGVSSMGAIRAYEMREIGMRGFGYVYDCFFQFNDFQDDELALLHNPSYPFHPISEPLINIRYFFSFLGKNNGVTESQVNDIITSLKCLWFGYRTLSLVKELLLTKTNMTISEINTEMSEFWKYRIKTIDLKNLLLTKPWELKRD